MNSSFLNVASCEAKSASMIWFMIWYDMILWWYDMTQWFMVQQAGQCYQSTIQYSNCNTKINHTVLTVVKLASLIYAQFQSSAKLSKVTTDVTMIDFDIMSLSYIYIYIIWWLYYDSHVSWELYDDKRYDSTII